MVALSAIRNVTERSRIPRLLGILRCARRVREPVRFVVGESVRPPGRLEQYHLRESGVVVHLRHRTPDFITFEQGFRRREFELPAEVRTAVADGEGAPTVLDLGANIGLFSAYVLGALRPRRIVAFEPDPSNGDVLRRTIAANDDAVTWELVEACAAPADGMLTFAAGGFGQSRTAVEEEAPDTIVVPAVDVFPQLAAADLVKFDIEGSEWEILIDERFSAIPARAVHFEYHARLCPEPNPRELATQRLRAAGFEVKPMFESSPGNGLLWAWRSGP